MVVQEGLSLSMRSVHTAAFSRLALCFCFCFCDIPATDGYAFAPRRLSFDTCSSSLYWIITLAQRPVAF